MSDILELNPGYNSHMVKSRRLVASVSVVANAAPASKTHNSDISDSLILRTEGLTATADAIEDLSATFTAANDANGIFGILIHIENAGKILSASVKNEAGTEELVSSPISSGKNIALDVDSAIDLSTTDQTFSIVVEYLLD